VAFLGPGGTIPSSHLDTVDADTPSLFANWYPAILCFVRHSCNVIVITLHGVGTNVKGGTRGQSGADPSLRVAAVKVAHGGLLTYQTAALVHWTSSSAYLTLHRAVWFPTFSITIL
jgi:hypothetical protein